jgi:lipoprotein NlpI
MRATWIACATLIVLAPTTPAGEKPQQNALEEAVKLLKRGKESEALVLVNKALDKDAKDARAWLLRGVIQNAQGKHAEAVTDLTKAIELKGQDLPEAYDRRGDAYLKKGDMDKALADFDRFLELVPRARPQHWRRGIACYYAKKYDEGNKQFEVHQTVNPEDVENAVWRYLCQAQLIGRDKARAQMLKIKADSRVPMMTVYDLFLGKAKPDDVLKAAGAKAATADDAKGQMFYAHLYLGLYYESEGDAKKAREHIDLAAGEFNGRDYMSAVAKVHRDLRKKGDKAK